MNRAALHTLGPIFLRAAALKGREPLNEQNFSEFFRDHGQRPPSQQVS
jgi:hypothetical protein